MYFAMRYARAVVLTLALLCAQTTTAQEGCRVRTVPVSAFSRQGASVPLVESANFVASYGDKAVRVTSVTVEQRPQQMVLLLDVSGSMLGATDRAWKVPIEVAREVLGYMPPNMDIGLAIFSGRMFPLVDPTKDHQKLIGEVEALLANRRLIEEKLTAGTALWDSILQASGMFRRSQAGDVIYVITDGADNQSIANSRVVARTLAATGVRLFCFGIANSEWLKLRTADQVTGATELTRVMEGTGGWGMAATVAEWDAFRETRMPEGFERAMNLQYRQLANFYRVNLELPEPISQPQQWKLLLTGMDEPKTRDLELIYPAQLMPCN